MIGKIERISSKEVCYVKEVLDSQFSASHSVNMLGRCEEAFAKKLGIHYAIGHINGTATLHSALYACGVKAGDEVIVPPLTMSSTAMAVLQQDAIPVFADVDENTFQIDYKSICKLITSRTRAIITVSLYGLSPDMDAIMAIAHKHNLKVIEDNAQCFFAEYKKRTVGTIGHFSSFSFQSSKHLSSGEGGMLCTNDKDLADKARKFSVLGYAGVSADKGKITKDDIQDPSYNRHVCLGYNYRMPELCAAVCLGQIERAGELIQRRIDVANLFKEVVSSCSWLTPQKFVETEYKNVYWAFAVKLEHPDISWKEFRKKFMDLGGDGIYAAWKLSYLESMFEDLNFSGKEYVLRSVRPDINLKYMPSLCPIAEKIQKQILAFKTNYWDWDRALEQADILKKTISYYDKK